MHRPGVFRSVVLLVVVSAALCACQMKEEAPAEAAQAAMTPTAQNAAENAAGAISENAAAPQAGTPIQAVASGVVASSEGDLPNMRVEINELKRDSSGTLTLKLTLLNTGTERESFGYNFGDPKRTPDYGSVGGVHLLDNVNKAKLDVMRDADDHCVCSRSIKDLEPGAQARLWAKFTAPPENVNAVTVVVPHFIPMENVPITQ